MKQHTNDLKTAIKSMGRQIESTITYGQTTLKEELYKITPHYEGNLLKSIMKQLDIECSVEIPLGTVLNYKLGILVNGEYEQLNFGNYIVYKVEKQEDADKYTITCYDKMLYTMVSYTSMNVTYPITIKNYLQTICNTFGLTFKNANETFVNYNKEIASELYLDTDGNDIGYTFRDVLDEIAQATASNIIINNNDELEVKYFTQTNETINEEMLKDVNVKFGQSYEMNTIVLSRAGGADKIYKSYPENLPDEDKKAIEIQDNQIMNWNDRDTYMESILNQLRTMLFYINDFSSTGICYLDPCDIYNIQIGETSYPCVMLNDEIDITTGLEELIHTDMPEGSETDYKKADKTDRRINQTYLIVDKQNQKIEGIITQIGDRSEKTTSITADIDRIESSIGSIQDLTNDVTGTKTITISDAYPNENPLEIHIYGNNSVFAYLYPQDNLYPGDNLYPYGDSRIRFYNANEDRTIELGITEVLRANASVRDEVFIDYNGIVQLIRRVNADGTTKANAETTTLGVLNFKLIEGDNTFEIVNYMTPIEIKYVMKSEITNVFATKAEMNSSITQTANEINLKVEEKLDEEDFTGANITLAINNDVSSATINADKININGTVSANGNFKVDTDGNMEAVNGKFTGGNIDLIGGTQENPRWNIYKDNNKDNNYRLFATNNFLMIREGQGNYVNIQATGTTAIQSIHGDSNYYIYSMASGSQTLASTLWQGTDNYTQVANYGIRTPSLTQTSLESEKKNFNKLDNAMDILKNIDIYKYNLKTENDNDKQHIGFVIGDNYKYSNEITSKNNDGVDIYSFVSVCCKAIQEQQQTIEKLEQRINELEGGKE